MEGTVTTGVTSPSNCLENTVPNTVACLTLIREKESLYRPAPVTNFFLPKKKGGPQRKDFGGGYGFPVFFSGFCIHHRPGKFFF